MWVEALLLIFIAIIVISSLVGGSLGLLKEVLFVFQNGLKRRPGAAFGNFMDCLGSSLGSASVLGPQNVSAH
jgi:hypothetical protein